MTERFTVQMRKGTTVYEIKDKAHELPIIEGLYYKSNAEKLCKFLNEQEKTFKRFNDKITELHWENHQLTTRIETIKNTIEEAYQTERTELGRSVLKQLLEKIQ